MAAIHLDLSMITKMTFTGQVHFTLFRPATQSSTYNSSYGANNAVDGDINSLSGTALGDFNPWWKVQLGVLVWVTRVEITNVKHRGG